MRLHKLFQQEGRENDSPYLYVLLVFLPTHIKVHTYSIQVDVFWDVTPYSVVVGQLYFGRTYCLHVRPARSVSGLSSSIHIATDNFHNLSWYKVIITLRNCYLALA